MQVAKQVIFTCAMCQEQFDSEVWHCPSCGHHWQLHRDTCGNCQAAQPTKALSLKEKFKLVRIENRAISTIGFRHDLLEEHLDDHRRMSESEQWCSPECLSRVIFGRNTSNNRAGIRKRLSRAFREMLKRRRFLAIEYASRGNGHNGEAIAFKFVEANEAGQARQYAIDRLEKMRRHLRMTEAELEIAKALLKIDA